MQFSKTVVPTTLIAAVSAANVTVTTEVVVTDFTTYCPLPTTVVVNNKTITVTEATTLTITGPCTLPTTYTTAEPSKYSNVTTYENNAGKVVGGAVAGFAAIAAALL